MAHKAYAPSNVPQLLQQLGLPRNQQQSLQHILLTLEQTGKVLRQKGNRYTLPEESNLISGIIQITRGGRGFVQPDAPGLPEIAIPETGTGTALHGDRVFVKLDAPRRGSKASLTPETTGTVASVAERKRMQFVGTLRADHRNMFVQPDDPRISISIQVPKPKDVGRQAQIGDKVVVEIRHWQSRDEDPQGEIIEVLGAPDKEGVDMLSVLRHHELPLSFPKAVLAEAHDIVASRSLTDAAPADLVGRTDCRDHAVITIDPDDAKDFDDAIYIEKHGAQWKLWVHIADVSHYVTPGSALDKEAHKRGNSTYLVDRVIPMLPEALSNELCSLKPNVDRLTKCVEFVLDAKGSVVSAKFYSAVIRSKRRFTYKEVLACLGREPTDAIETMVHQAHGVAQSIRRRRFEDGSLDLDFPESKIRLDEQGRVRLIERIENDVSHQLIEEFMLLANEAVAARLMGLNRPAVYRIHEAPKAKRLGEYRDEVLSHRVECGNLTVRSEVQQLLSRLGELPIGPALKIGFLKSLMRARYAVEPLGHYGLSKPKYTHFTSPIRRYADLVVHRALFDVKEACHIHMGEIANHITTTERTSSDAERDSKEVKLFAYLKAQLSAKKPEVYRATVTDVRNSVFFVDVVDLGMSCGVPVSSLADDYFVFDAQKRQLIGKRTNRIIRLGDVVMVQVRKVDDEKKQADFQLAATEGEAKSDRKWMAKPSYTKKPSFTPGKVHAPVRRGVAEVEPKWKAKKADPKPTKKASANRWADAAK